MALIQCKECGKDVSSEAVTCPSCGIRVRPKSKTVLYVLLVPLGLVGLFLLYGFYIISTPEGKQRTKDREAYRYCMQTLKDNPGNPIAKDACEMLREDFTRKYGRNP